MPSRTGDGKLPPRKKGKGTFAVRLKPLFEVISGEPHAGIEVTQPVCFGGATLILSEEDIGRFQSVLEKAKFMLWKAKEKRDGAPVDATGEPVEGE